MEISNVRPPVESRPNLDAVNDTFIVPNGLIFDYYPVKVSEFIPGMFLKLDVSPPALKEGYICYKNQLYKVSVEQLLKRKIHVRSKYFPPNARAATTTGTTSEPATTESVKEVQSGNNQSSSFSDSWDQELKAANMAFERQIESLRAFGDQEEEWLAPPSSESRPSNEGGSESNS